MPYDLSRIRMKKGDTAYEQAHVSFVSCIDAMKKENRLFHREVGEKLAKKLSVSELVSQLMHSSKGIKQLGILPYNWWNECLHGVARAGTATVFPQAICMAASFSADLLFQTAEIISTEARAKFNESQRQKDYGVYKGLTMWSPNINIFRDPRWGRGQETYGEDPYLTGVLGTAFIKGLQGNDEKYIKTAACAKHFAVHSGPESERHAFNAVVSKKDMMETYLPAFKRAVTDGGVCGVMGAYNCVNGEACCASETLIKRLLRTKWGFEGYFVSDCGALTDIVSHHRLTSNPLKGAAMALNAGCDLECGKYYRLLPAVYMMHYISKETLQESAGRLLSVRSQLGMFDENCCFHKISAKHIASEENEKAAVRAAQKGIVMLENNGILPLKQNCQKILILGYNAENELAYLGNYFGTPKRFIKVTDAVKAMHADTDYCTGYCYQEKENAEMQKEALQKAADADVILLCTGLDCSMEGEEAGELLKGGGGNLGKQGDRSDLDLPYVQQTLLEKLIQTGKKTVILNFSGGCIDFGKYVNRVDAILQCWYPGAAGGQAIADILFGKCSPSGKLPVTFYKDIRDLPDFDDYSMANRTYRYFSGDVLYPFGYGLTYTHFKLTKCSIQDKTIQCTVKNTGAFASDEVLQLYVTQPQTDYQNPICSLIRIQRFSLAPNEAKDIIFNLCAQDLFSVNPDGDTVYLRGEYQFTLSDGQDILETDLHFLNGCQTKVIEKCPI